MKLFGIRITKILYGEFSEKWMVAKKNSVCTWHSNFLIIALFKALVHR